MDFWLGAGVAYTALALTWCALVLGRALRRHVGQRVAWGWHGGVLPARGPHWWKVTAAWSWVALFTVLHPVVSWRAWRTRRAPQPDPNEGIAVDLFTKDA